jgi:hypothetical protein
MDTLWNLADMVVDGRLSTGRALSRDDLTADQIERFSALVDRDVVGDECHEWTGSRLPKGYGTLPGGGGTSNIYAHRIAYVLAYGLIPAGLVVRHKCDNPKCVRAKHLTLGSVKDNSRDAVERGDMNAGERNGQAKLTVEKVNCMRRLARAGASYTDLAAEYGVARTQAYNAATGKTWKSATEPPVTGVRNGYRPWTPEEDAVIFDGTAAEVAARLGRSVCSVEKRRERLRARQGVAA